VTSNAEVIERDGRWVLQNTTLAIEVDKESGKIVGVVDRVDGVDFCRPSQGNAEMIGGLRVADQLVGQTYCDLQTPSTVSLVSSGAGPGDSQQIVLSKQFEGAQFSVRITYRMDGQSLMWLAELEKKEGADRSVRITFIVPQASRRLWGAMADPFVDLYPEQPIMLRHGLAHGHAVAHQRRSLPVPIVTFVREERCLALALPVEVPNVLVRFMNNADEEHVNVLNSLGYPPEQREYFKVCYDFLGLREGKVTRAGVLLSSQRGQWREALGWYADRYPKHFHPDPKISKHDGVYAGTRPMDGGLEEDVVRENMKKRHQRGVKWAELHCHFPRYGLYVNPTEPWRGEHTQTELTFDMVRQYIRLLHEQDIAVHTYYNIIDGECNYAEREFPESIVRDEEGKMVPAFRECWLMNADPSTPFGKHSLEQFSKLLDTYPESDAVFFDVYGRHYDIDFGHDDGLTMIHNKPAYCLKFAFARIMERIEPILRSRGMVFSANKPEGIETLAGIDCIMGDEGLDQDRLEAFSYYGLFKPIMTLNGQIWRDPESTFKTCLRLGMLHNDLGDYRYEYADQVTAEMLERNERIRVAYAPLLQYLVGKQWVLQANVLELPSPTRGNIFRIPDDRYVVTMVSDDRTMFEQDGYRENLPVIVRLDDAASIKSAVVHSPDYSPAETAAIARDGDTMTVTVARHRTASVVVLSK
jgi:hypothetical protein